LEGTKLLGLKQQSHFIGYRGREYGKSFRKDPFENNYCADKLWNLHFPDLEGFEGITKENFFNFTSPWATSMQEEIFFDKTCTDIGLLLGCDLNLYVLYQTLLIVSNPQVKDSSIKQIKENLSMMLYRYLRRKYDSQKASMNAHNLIGMTSILYACGKIITHKRLKI